MPPSSRDTYDDARATPLSVDFFNRGPGDVAPDLLGCVLVSRADDLLTAGRIVETEAYLGSEDPGSHASTRGITKRNAVMYGAPGTAYVYFTYGNHHMVNLVCGPDGIAGAVLIRALEPLAGLDTMTSRRHGRSRNELCNGPGKLAEALGVDLRDNGTALGIGRLAVYDGERPALGGISVTGRVGLSAGHELDLRYYITDSPFVSRGRTGPLPRVRRREAT